MTSIRTVGVGPVLVAVDPSARSQPGLAKAARLATATRRRLLVYACDWREGLDDGRVSAAGRRRLEADGLKALSSMVRSHLGSARRFTARYQLGHPRAEFILAAVRRERPGLVVLDSHFHAEARRALFGAADWPLIRECPVPLLYAKPGRWHAAPRIAAAVDPRHAADPRARLDGLLVATARHYARALSGSLYVVNAWLPLEPTLAGPGLFGMAPLDATAADRLVAGEEVAARAAVGGLLSRTDKPRGEVVLLRGAAVDTLPGFAELEGLDVLVMGSVARSRLYELLIGATAERLLERVACDVLIVRGARPRAADKRRGPRRLPL